SITLSPEESRDLELFELSPIRCQGTLSFMEPDFLLRATVQYEARAACNRCLKDVDLPVSTSFDLVMVEKTRRREATAEEELEARELGLVEVDTDGFDSRPLILEQVEFSLPMKPLCRENCQGLCPQCGQDLNEGRCNCRSENTDPRWAVLATLKDPPPGGAGSGN
ncbi:MAG: DUF177 domain-containing protein, partial [Thermoanaerobaculia bacterium]